MDIFGIGLIILLFATVIFYIIFFSLVYYWHNTKISYVVVPFIFTFEFFIAGFFVLAIVTIIVNNYPQVINLLWQ